MTKKSVSHCLRQLIDKQKQSNKLNETNQIYANAVNC